MMNRSAVFRRPASGLDLALRLSKQLFKGIGRPNLAGSVFTRARLAARPMRALQRRSLARNFSSAPKMRSAIPCDRGYLLFKQTDIPEMDKLLRACDAVLDNKGRDEVLLWHQKRAKSPSKGFFFNVLEEEDLTNCPDIMEFVLSDTVLSLVIPYYRSNYGLVPQLSTVGLYVSPANPSLDDLRGSQNYHLDGTDPHHLKCFINLNEVDDEAGPFTFIPRDRTDELRIRNGGLSRSAGLENANLLDNYDREYSISLTGGPGTGAFVDTSNCLHYGSRSYAKNRIVLMFHFAIFANYTEIVNNPLRDLRMQHYPKIRKRFARDPLRQAVLSVGGQWAR